MEITFWLVNGEEFILPECGWITEIAFDQGGMSDFMDWKGGKA